MKIPGEPDYVKFFTEGQPGITVVRNTPNERESLKAEKKAERRQNYPNPLSFLLGLVILIFAVIGIVLIIVNSVQYINSTRDTAGEFSVYNTYLTPVAAVDPDAFDDITAADTEQLLEISIWSILSADSTPDTYSYDGGYMLIPASDVAAAYESFFGPETSSSLTHTTVQAYNCTFTYDSVSDVYKIPVTTVTPIYTPEVTSVEQSGDSLTITVNYLATESWAFAIDGSYSSPTADKVMKITLREIQGNYYIGAIQTVSNTTPETIYYEATTQAETTTEEIEAETVTETTTAQEAVKTTLGGNVS